MDFSLSLEFFLNEAWSLDKLLRGNKVISVANDMIPTTVRFALTADGTIGFVVKLLLCKLLCKYTNAAHGENRVSIIDSVLVK